MSEQTVTLIAAIASTIIGVGTFIHLFLLAYRWPRATGQVVGNVTGLRSTDGNEYAYFPVIEFRAADGKSYEVRGDIGVNQSWPIGQSIELRYRASNPKHTTTMKGWQRLLFSMVFIAFAVACWLVWLGM